MRLTKGQLKRIIREEYTRLKRQGLIRESSPRALDPEMQMDLEELEDQLSMSCPDYQRGDLYDAIMEDIYEGGGQYFVKDLLKNCDDPFLVKQVLKWASQVSAELSFDDMY